MNRNVFFALIAGLLGGLLTRYVAPPPAFAQNQAPITKEIRAQSFTLVDQSNRAVGTFTIRPDFGSLGSPNTPVPGGSRPTRIVLLDPNGNEIWSAGQTQLRRLSEK